MSPVLTSPVLGPGPGSLVLGPAGFKTLTLSNIDVGVDQRVRIDLKLEVGAMTESVTIEATASLVQTSSLELSTTVDDEQIEALPLNGRTFAPHRSTTQWRVFEEPVMGRARPFTCRARTYSMTAAHATVKRSHDEKAPRRSS